MSWRLRIERGDKPAATPPGKMGRDEKDYVDDLLDRVPPWEDAEIAEKVTTDLGIQRSRQAIWEYRRKRERDMQAALARDPLRGFQMDLARQKATAGRELLAEPEIMKMVKGATQAELKRDLQRMLKIEEAEPEPAAPGLGGMVERMGTRFIDRLGPDAGEALVALAALKLGMLKPGELAQLAAAAEHGAEDEPEDDDPDDQELLDRAPEQPLLSAADESRLEDPHDDTLPRLDNGEIDWAAFILSLTELEPHAAAERAVPYLHLIGEDYRGLLAAELSELRKLARALSVPMKVGLKPAGHQLVPFILSKGAATWWPAFQTALTAFAGGQPHGLTAFAGGQPHGHRVV